MHYAAQWLDMGIHVLLRLFEAVFMRNRESRHPRNPTDAFSRMVMAWLSKAPRSFVDIVAAFDLPSAQVRARLQALIRAGFLRASNAEPIDYARSIWVVRMTKTTRAARVQSRSKRARASTSSGRRRSRAK